MGMGHVPAGPVPAAGPHHELPRREYRGARARNRALVNRRTARLGESLAARFLQARGARIIGRNVRAGRGEFDLLARWGATVVAVEVKTRVGADPRPAFTAEKSRRMWEAIAVLRPRPHRLDLVAVELGAEGVDIRWIPGVV